MPAQRASEHFYHRYSISSFNQTVPGRGNWSLSHVFGFPHPWLWPCFSSLHAICYQRWAGTGHLLAVWARADITIIIAYSNYYIFQPKTHFSQLALCYCAWMKPQIVQRDKITTEYCLINIRVKWVEIIRHNQYLGYDRLISWCFWCLFIL